MPIYEYVCKACGYEFERLQPFSADPLKTCPRCGGSVRRVISPVGVIFKGSGWYITDSKRQLSATSSKGKRQITGADADKPAAAAAPAATSSEGSGAAPDSGAKGPESRGGRAASTSGTDR